MASYLAILVSESDRIGRLINQVLDIEKLHAEENQQIPVEPVNINEVIEQLVLGMEPIFNEKNIRCSYQNDAISAQILGQRDRIMQVLVNLISNATKFCNPEKGTIHIWVFQHDTQLNIQVIDNGRGIPDNAKEMIFGQFAQLNHPKLGKPDGTGLGLYISKQIIQQHNGKITVQDAKGGGAVFTVEFPISN